MHRKCIVIVLASVLCACSSSGEKLQRAGRGGEDLASVTETSSVAVSLIKGATLNCVYYLEQTEEKRYVFPTSAEFFSWFDSTSGIETLPDASVASVAIGGNVQVRAGTLTVYRSSNTPQKYWVGENKVLHPIQGEQALLLMNGYGWTSPRQVSGVGLEYNIWDAFFTNYGVGDPITANKPWCNGMLFCTNVAGKVYLMDDGLSREVTEDAMRENFFQHRFVRLRPDLGDHPSGQVLDDASYYREHLPSAPFQSP